VSNSGSRVVVAEDRTQVDKLVEQRAQLPDVQQVVVIDGPGDGNWVITLADLEERGRQLIAESPNVVEDRVREIRPDHLATLIYTSGTTGKPKGVRLPHSAWTYTAAAVDALGILGPDDLQYLWLPLSHVFGKVLLGLPLQVGLPTASDGRVEKIVENLAVVQPTFMGAAPRVFEKAHARPLCGWSLSSRYWIARVISPSVFGCASAPTVWFVKSSTIAARVASSLRTTDSTRAGA